MWEWMITVVLVAIECLEVGLQLLSKEAMSRGMSNFIFVVYSNAFAFLFLIPPTIIFHRIKPPPHITIPIVSKLFFFSLISCFVQTSIYIGIRYSSATLSSVMLDLTPAFTFILAIITRMENLEIKVYSSQAKLVGSIILITGAFIVTFYKGPPIFFSHWLSDVIYAPEPLLSPQSNWALGGSLLAAGSFLLAIMYIFQAKIIEDYPSELMVTMFCCFFVTIQSSIIALIAERNPNVWKLRPDLELVTICYAAVGVVSLRLVAHSWALRKKGPVFVSMFKPLRMVIAVIIGVTFLGDILHIGSVIGGILIALGFYSLMWGKTKEWNAMLCSHLPSNEIPFIRNKSIDV